MISAAVKRDIMKDKKESGVNARDHILQPGYLRCSPMYVHTQERGLELHNHATSMADLLLTSP